MKKSLLILLSLFLLEYNLQAQDCYLLLGSQSSVNAFANTTCSNITHLEISVGNGSDKIVDLTPLSNITSVNGNVILSLGDIENIKGLNNITTIKGNLEIKGATKLTDLSGLGASNSNAFHFLYSIGGYLNIIYCPSIRNISGFFSLHNVGGIDIFRCDSLVNISGFNNLVKTDSINPNINGQISISENKSLKSITGYQNLTNIYGLNIGHNNSLDDISSFNLLREAKNISIQNNSSLSSISGFNGKLNCKYIPIQNNPKLKKIIGFTDLGIIGSFTIYGNNSIANISGFNKIEQVTGDLLIFGNDSLVDISGFKDLKSSRYISIYDNKKLINISGFNSLTLAEGIYLNDNKSLTNLSGIFAKIDYPMLTVLGIYNNTSLSTCSIPWLCGYLKSGGSSTIFGNSNGCNNASAILAGCVLTGLSEKAETKILSFYPNPASDKLYLSEVSNYTITDMTGKFLFKNEGSEISLAGLNAGLYYITINGRAEKFVKE